MLSSKLRPSRVLAFFALCLFLASILLPFLTIKYKSIAEEEDYYVTYWSFKTTIIHTYLGRELKNETMTFVNYWSAPPRKGYFPPSLSGMSVSWAVVAIFVAQVLALLLGTISFFMERMLLHIFALISSVAIILLIAYVWFTIRSQTYFTSTYNIGYWALWLSTITYAMAIALESAKRLR